jgi:hypothetical protein
MKRLLVLAVCLAVGVFLAFGTSFAQDKRPKEGRGKGKAVHQPKAALAPKAAQQRPERAQRVAPQKKKTSQPRVAPPRKGPRGERQGQPKSRVEKPKKNLGQQGNVRRPDQRNERKNERQRPPKDRVDTPRKNLGQPGNVRRPDQRIERQNERQKPPKNRVDIPRKNLGQPGDVRRPDQRIERKKDLPAKTKNRVNAPRKDLGQKGNDRKAGIQSNRQPRPSDQNLQKKLKAPVNKQGQERARAKFTAERQKFQHHHAEKFRPTPRHHELIQRVHIDPGTYYNRRYVFFNHYAYAPPVWAYNLYPRYGIWDTTFLCFMLDHAFDSAYSSMYYHHRHDDDFIQWRREMNALARQNVDLQRKLDILDYQASLLGDEPVNPYYLPPDVDDIAFSPDIFDLN